MPPLGAFNPVSTVDAASSPTPPAPQLSESPLAVTRDAFSCQAGVTVRLLASLPANLGQEFDRSV